MSSAAQRTELQAQIWKIANEVRGSVDGWDFKQYVLGILFYRFISENFSNYMEGGDDSIHYAELDDTIITKEIKEDAVKTKGYFIYPSQLFCRIAENANTNESLNTDLKTIFDEIENSASGYPSEQDIKGLFADFDTTSNRLGNTVKDKNTRLAAVIKGVEGLNFGNFEDNQIDLFGDAYEFLISNYAANAGKSGGEFFTPQCVSKLIAKLAIHGQTSINKIYDPAAGSGSLLLQAKKQFDEHVIEDGFFGQEINHTTYNLARMNMFLHNVNYDKFSIALGNTLTEPHFGNDKPFDAIVSNPPYSINWIGNDDPTLINDERFAPAGVLAPKSKADFAFIQSLPGQKWLLKGNHDYWWTTTRKMETFLAANGFDTLHILHNNACIVDDTALCGTRGWPFDDLAAQGEKLMAREAGRLRMSLQAAGDAAQRIAFLHYPPIYPGAAAQELVDVLHDFGVTECYYGHLHGKSIRYATQGERDGITYRLISADGLAFCPYKIR